jgi:YfiH family protein
MIIQTVNADWIAPKNVYAVSTIRTGGISKGFYNSFNLANHVGDNEFSVAENRSRLRSLLKLPSEPVWLEQIHSNKVVCLDEQSLNLQADASYTLNPGVICVVLTADCLPILLCNEAGTKIAAIHAGWQGLLSGIIENTVKAMQEPHLLAWLGPAIGFECFEVGEEVRAAFCKKADVFSRAFKAKDNGKWLADIYQLSRITLTELGIENIYGGRFCTVTEKERFFSYRRDGQTGRMATLIWRD